MPFSSKTKMQLFGINGIYPVGILTGSHCDSTQQVLCVVHFYNSCSFYRVLERGGLWHRKPAPCETYGDSYRSRYERHVVR
jgi:hypothetical protein